MRYPLPLALATVAALFVTGCAGPNLRGYSIVRAVDSSAADSSCRLLADPNKGLRSFCVDAARWEQYDQWAASNGVTCHAIPGQPEKPSQDACLTAGEWRRLRVGPASIANSSSYGGSIGPLPDNSALAPSLMPHPSTSSHGPFPSGGAIGQTFN
jgi:hypothetical protein